MPIPDASTLTDADLRRRVERLVRGERRTDDLDRLYLGMRERACGRASVREIGDFVAHRGQREKGPVTTRVRDVFVSYDSWLRGLSGQAPKIGHVRKVACANLRTTTDAQLRARLGLRRPVVASVLEQGLRKLEAGRRITDRERAVINHLGFSFIWNRVFTAGEVLEDLTHVLRRHGLLREGERSRFEEVAPSLALYVVALLHGSAVLLDGGGRAELFATFGDERRRLEVRANLVVSDLGKPIVAPVCVFWTELDAAEWCDPGLVGDPEAWSGPLEVDGRGLLAPLT